MVKYPNSEAIRENLDLTVHALCTHISKDMQKFIKTHIFKRISGFKGLSLRELDVLMCVDYFRGPVNSADVAETIRFDPATVSRATQNLLNHGLLQKDDNIKDSRSMLLSLTDEGAIIAQEFKTKTSEALEAADQAMKMTLTPYEREEFLRLLLKMRHRSVEYARLKKMPNLQMGASDNISSIADARKAKTA